MATCRIDDPLLGSMAISFRRDYRAKDSCGFTARQVNFTDNCLWPTDDDLVIACRSAYPEVAAYKAAKVWQPTVFHKALDFSKE